MDRKTAAVSNGYVALKLSETDSAKLAAILKAIGISDFIDPSKMHLTLMYDKSGSPKQYEAKPGSYKAKIIGCDKLGEKGSEWEAIVLKLVSPEISARHEALKAQGYKHSHDNFIQHVSLKYKPSEIDFDTIKRFINAIKKHMPEISLDSEYTEHLSDKALTEKYSSRLKSLLSKKVASKASKAIQNIEKQLAKDLGLYEAYF